MKYFYDTEFLEDGQTIDLISIGIVAEDGREYYAVNSDANWDRIAKNDWLMKNVWPHLPLRGRKPSNGYVNSGSEGILDTSSVLVKPKWVIRNEIREFLSAGTPPELWAWYSAYDHVVLAQMWGRMINLPKGLPMFTNDVRSLSLWTGVDELPKQTGAAHNALADAKHVKEMYEHIMEASK